MTITKKILFSKIIQILAFFARKSCTAQVCSVIKQKLSKKQNII